MKIYIPTNTVWDILSRKEHHRVENLRARGWKYKGEVSASVIHEMHTKLLCDLLNVHTRNVIGRENLGACGWKYKEQHSASAIHEMHMTLPCELLNVQNYHMVSWLTGGEGAEIRLV